MTSIEEKILELWTSGHTTSKIAAALGRSKNSICGSIFRMREKGITIPPKRSTRDVIVPKKTVERAPKPKVVRPPMTGHHFVSKKRKELHDVAKYTKGSAKDSLNIGFWKLKPHSCRYVVNDSRPENFIFCGAPQERGSYCAEHAAICFIPPKVPSKEYQRSNARFK
jgi:GcrA cell cycle regulator